MVQTAQRGRSEHEAENAPLKGYWKLPGKIQTRNVLWHLVTAEGKLTSPHHGPRNMAAGVRSGD